MIRFSLYLPEPVVEKLQALSKTKDLSVAELIRRAVEQYLKMETK